MELLRPLEPGSTEAGSLIATFLGDQGDLTAVERFAQFHEGVDRPIQDRYYASLLPASPPGPGQQLAFEVDLDRCSGCKACVVACHALNGLDDGEAWRDVGLVVGVAAGLPVLQHVTSSCHHCVDPACLNACPVDAYEKDPLTGIVKHLDDQCFGCQYCTLACPYDAPKFHAAKGIVRKCDMCADRLGAGEAPACVQACPHEAIRIRVVDHREVIARAEVGAFLTGAPDPITTLPTTRYVSNRQGGNTTRPVDHLRNEPEHVHWSLVLMLVLTQMSAGGFAVDLALRASGARMSGRLAALSLAAGVLGLAASTFHLGRPHYAYRALIGLRHSWLSREVAAFGLFAALATAHVALGLLAPAWSAARPALGTALATAVAAAGLAGVGSSIMVYHVVNRPFWRAPASGAKFFATTTVLGLALGLTATARGNPPATALWPMEVALMAVVATKLVIESSLLRHLRDPRFTSLRRSALLVRGPLAGPAMLRLALGIGGGLALPATVLAAGPSLSPTWHAAALAVLLLVLLAGEVAERYLFFAAVVRPKMPGALFS